MSIEAMKQDEFLLRGILASELKCWHRLTAEETLNLVYFIKNMGSRQAIEQAQKQEPVAITITGKLGNIYSFTGDYSLKKGDKVYTSPPQRQPLTDEQTHEVIGTAGVDLFKLAKQWADNEIHVYQFDNEARKIIKAVLHRAHGIKGEA